MRRQLSRDMSADASFLFDKAAVLRETITETLCLSLLKVHVQRLSRLSEIYFCADKYNFSRHYKIALKEQGFDWCTLQYNIICSKVSVIEHNFQM